MWKATCMTYVRIAFVASGCRNFAIHSITLYIDLHFAIRLYNNNVTELRATIRGLKSGAPNQRWTWICHKLFRSSSEKLFPSIGLYKYMRRLTAWEQKPPTNLAREHLVWNERLRIFECVCVFCIMLWKILNDWPKSEPTSPKVMVTHLYIQMYSWVNQHKIIMMMLESCRRWVVWKSFN